MHTPRIGNAVHFCFERIRAVPATSVHRAPPLNISWLYLKFNSMDLAHWLSFVSAVPTGAVVPASLMNMIIKDGLDF